MAINSHFTHINGQSLCVGKEGGNQASWQNRSCWWPFTHKNSKLSIHNMNWAHYSLVCFSNWLWIFQNLLLYILWGTFRFENLEGFVQDYYLKIKMYWGKLNTIEKGKEESMRHLLSIWTAPILSMNLLQWLLLVFILNREELHCLSPTPIHLPLEWAPAWVLAAGAYEGQMQLG